MKIEGYFILPAMTKKKKPLFTEEAIENIRALGDALKDIHIRLIKEGYVIKDGEIIPPEDIDTPKDSRVH